MQLRPILLMSGQLTRFHDLILLFRESARVYLIALSFPEPISVILKEITPVTQFGYICIQLLSYLVILHQIAPILIKLYIFF